MEHYIDTMRNEQHPNRIEALVESIKNQPVIYLVITFGLIVIGLGNFTNAITDLKEFFVLGPKEISTTDNGFKEIQADKNLFDISFETEFDEVSDLDHYDILDIPVPSDEEIKIDSGKLYFGQPPLSAMNLKPTLTYNTAVHIRWKIYLEQTCFAFPIWISSQDASGPQSYSVGFGSCSYQELQIDYPDKSSDILITDEMSNILVTKPGQWMEGVFWVVDTPRIEFHGLAWLADRPSEYSVYKSDLPSWEGEDRFSLSFQGYDGEVAVDFLRIIEGEIESYLWFYAPPYTGQSDKVMDFFYAER